MEIPPELCVAGRDLTEPRLSPDGSLVTYVARGVAGSAAIVVVPVAGGPERQLSTLPAPAPGRGLGGGCYAWVPDGSGVVYGAVDGQLWLQPVPGGSPRALTALPEGASARGPQVSCDGSVIVYSVDDVEIRLLGPTGDVRLDDGGDDFVLDPHLAPRPSTAADAVTVRWQAWSVPDMPWDAALVREVEVVGESVVERRTAEGAGAIQQPSSLPDGRPIWVRDDHGWLNVWVDDVPLVAEPFEHAGPTWGPGQRSFAVSPDATSVAFTRNEAGFGRLCVVDVDGANDVDGGAEVVEVARGVHGQLEWGDRYLVALRTGARTPSEVVVYDTSAAPWVRRTLAVGPALAWDAVELPEPELVEVDVDGAVVHARRYVAGQGKTLCWVHGGPTDQWQVEFMPRVAFWWSRGWDVLVPDPRGTTGHGRAYQQALRGEWGRLDIDDTVAVLRHAYAAGWSSPDRTVAVGGSSGGLTVLGVLGQHPGSVAGGVALYPVCDLADLAERSHRFEAHYTLSLVGPLDDVERYRERSPLSYADQISAPLLVMHGDADPVVPVEQSRRLAERITAAGGDVRLHVFEGEGHGFRDPANKLTEFRLMGEHLDRVVIER